MTYLYPHTHKKDVYKRQHLHIEVSDFLDKATLYEVPLLAIVSEIKNQFFGNVADMAAQKKDVCAG